MACIDVDREREYAPAVEALVPVLHELPSKLVAIDGRPGVGKTTLGRYLACRFNVSLIESDLFMMDRADAFTYRNEEMVRIIDYRLSMPRPVIVDAVMALRLLHTLSRTPDFLLYVTNKNADTFRQSVETPLKSYDAEFTPRVRADFVLELDHNG